jgi:hypothetical protein
MKYSKRTAPSSRDRKKERSKEVKKGIRRRKEQIH